MLSNVRKFYANKNVLITGGTGFLGQILVERLLRCCPEIQNIYLLMRAKNESHLTTRKETYFDNSVFEKLKVTNPSVLDKVRYVQGDIELPNLGLSETDRDLLQTKINVVFHSAATVLFVEKLSKAVRTNLMGTKQILDLCKDIKSLHALIHVSTSYSNPNQKEVGEKVYPSSEVMPWNELLKHDELDRDESKIIKNWPNTYTFTKYSSEIMLSEMKEDIPLNIIRPGAVSGCAFEPQKGWIGNHHGVNTLLIDLYMNKLPVMHMRSGYNATMTPVDMCVNNMILAPWEMNENPDKNELKIYNNVPVENKVSNGHILWKFALKVSKENPEKDIQGVLLSRDKNLFKHFHPEYNYYHMVKFVGGQQWNIKGRNLNLLWEKMSAKDRELFPVNYNDIDWDTYIDCCYYGVKKFVEDQEKRRSEKKMRLAAKI